MNQILIVEDESDLRDVLKKLLEKEGFAVDLASNGRSALNKARKAHYDLVITDLRMPGMSGQQAIQKIEEISPRTRFIIISGYQLDADMALKIKQGVYAFFEKPFVNQEIINKVRELAGRR